MPTIEQARLWYALDDPVHGYDHVLRVLRLAEHLASQEGADFEIVRAAALFHDALIQLPDEQRDSEAVRSDHHARSAEYAGLVLSSEGWSGERIEAVQHCIQAHRYRDESTRPQTLEAKVLFDADKLDAIGAVGVARAIAYAVQHGQPFYSAPTPEFIASGRTQPGEPHSAYHEFLYKLIKIKDRLFTLTGRTLAEERQRRMIDYFEALALEMQG